MTTPTAFEPRSDSWIGSLVAGSPVILRTPAGVFDAQVGHIEPSRDGERLWLRVYHSDRVTPCFQSWVWRDTGNCPAAGLWVEPRPSTETSIHG